jgi:glucose-6-phosphate isomerase
MKHDLSINLKATGSFINESETASLAAAGIRHLDALVNKTGAGNDFLGWVTLPEEAENQIADIEKTADRLKKISDTTVVIGIGGSYLGARAVIEALANPLLPYTDKPGHSILYAGHNISEEYMSELLGVLDKKNYSVIVISKSGTTTEPAIAFRIIKNHIEKKYGKKEASERIVAVTDSKKGALRKLADKNGYTSYVIPDDVGGRFSVLTPVGLLPIAVAGFNIRELVKGSAAMAKQTRDNKDASSNPALIYAAARNILLQKGKNTEILVSFNPKLHFVAEWWKQLYGESEGKEGKGIYPSSVDFTTDLHSMGQYIQEGQRMIFETVLSVKNSSANITIPLEEDDSDQLNYISGMRLSDVNMNAEKGTVMAHNDGGVPVISVELSEITENTLGQLLYMFEIACGVSGYILGVNPFDQPGVEAYKKNMFALLNKPGFEEAGKELRNRL